MIITQNDNNNNKSTIRNSTAEFLFFTQGKLTAKYIEHNTHPKAKEYRKPDGEGLFLRVRPSGAKNWLFFFRIGTDRTWRQQILDYILHVWNIIF